MSCLLKLLALAIFVGVIAFFGLRFMDERDMARREEALAGPSIEEARRGVRQRLRDLAAGRADSVVVSAPEFTAVVLGALDPGIRSAVDSVVITLGEGEIVATGLVNPGRLPSDIAGPAGLVLKKPQRVRASGPLTVAEPGRGAWRLDDVRVAGVPVPSVVLRRTLGGRAPVDGETVAVPLPPGARDLRVRPSQVTFYREMQR